MRAFGCILLVFLMVEAAHVLMVEAAHGGPQWPQRPWVRLVLALSNNPRYLGNAVGRRHAEVFLNELMSTKEPHEEEAIAFWPDCRDKFVDFLEFFLEEESRNGAVLNRAAAQECTKRIADGSLETALQVPHDARKVYRFLTATGATSQVAFPPLIFGLTDKKMSFLGWLPFAKALMRQPPYSQDEDLIKKVEEYEQLLLSSPHDSEAGVLTNEPRSRRIMTQIIKQIFEMEKRESFWMYSPEFIEAVLERINAGVFEEMLSQSEAAQSLLTYVSAGEVAQPSSPAEPETAGRTSQSPSAGALFTLVIPVVLWWTEVLYL